MKSRKVTILGREIVLRDVPQESEAWDGHKDLAGCWDSVRHEVLVREDLCSESYDDTLVHELFHAAFHWLCEYSTEEEEEQAVRHATLAFWEIAKALKLRPTKATPLRAYGKRSGKT